MPWAPTGDALDVALIAQLCVDWFYFILFYSFLLLLFLSFLFYFLNLLLLLLLFLNPDFYFFTFILFLWVCFVYSVCDLHVNNNNNMQLMFVCAVSGTPVMRLTSRDRMWSRAWRIAPSRFTYLLYISVEPALLSGARLLRIYSQTSDLFLFYRQSHS